MKKIISVLIAVMILVLALSDTVYVSAQDSEGNVTQKGTVDLLKGDAEILLRGKEGQTLKGKKLNLYQIFLCEKSKDGNSVLYKLNPAFEKPVKTIVAQKISKEVSMVTENDVLQYMQSFHESSDTAYRYFIEELKDEIRKQKIAGEEIIITETAQDNSVVIKGLQYGYYLIDEVTDVSEKHSAASLCMVDTAAPAAVIQIKSDYPSVTKKIQEDDNKEQIKNDGWNDMADFETGQTVPYQYLSSVPDMAAYRTYFYAWHDRMDSVLTLKKDSITIMIKDDTSSYQLKNEEFQLKENPGKEETFQISIPDLKAVVDREFKGKGYGQTVLLRYDAVLNEKAAHNTGRPGFENDVRLEFSNNPDSDGEGSTGETPWDTVVCFTYRLNGLKTNEKGTALEGAQFCLYRDELCKEKVPVVKSGLEYHVMNGKKGESSLICSDGEGKFTVAGLDQGTYYLKEIKAPEGYKKADRPVKITITPEFTEDRNAYIKGDGSTQRALKNLKISADDQSLKTDPEQGEGNLIVINHSGSRLPATGSAATVLLTAAGIFLIGCSLSRKKKERDDSNGR